MKTLKVICVAIICLFAASVLLTLAAGQGKSASDKKTMEQKATTGQTKTKTDTNKPEATKMPPTEPEKVSPADKQKELLESHPYLSPTKKPPQGGSGENGKQKEEVRETKLAQGAESSGG